MRAHAPLNRAQRECSRLVSQLSMPAVSTSSLRLLAIIRTLRHMSANTVSATPTTDVAQPPSLPNKCRIIRTSTRSASGTRRRSNCPTAIAPTQMLTLVAATSAHGSTIAATLSSRKWSTAPKMALRRTPKSTLTSLGLT